MSKVRTLQICLSDIPKEKILKHPNGKEYIFLKTKDYFQTNERDDDFSISLMLTAEEQERKKAGQEVKQIFVGAGKIYNQ